MMASDAAYGHIGDMYDAAAALENVGSPFANRILNSISTHMTGNPKLTSFETVRTAVSDEMARAMKGAAISDTEIAHWKALWDGANTKESIQAAIVEGQSLLSRREAAIKNKFKIDTGRDYPDFISQPNRDKAEYIRKNPLRTGVTVIPQEGGGSGGGGGSPPPAGRNFNPRTGKFDD